MTYDYIIIGAGSAGCVLANRLSAKPENKVLLVEAGGPDSNSSIHIPAAFPKLFRTKEDWNYDTVPQEHMLQRKLFQPRGKVLGGCSSTNAMIYIRGHRADYDGWAALGNQGWSYEEVLPYFKKSEGNQVSKNEFHNAEGELSVVKHQTLNILSHTFLKAAQEAGYPLNSDFNGAQQEGFGYYQLTQKDGKRCSAAVAFLKPVMNRPNLTVITGAEVQKIDIENKQAKGITFLHKNQKKSAEAGKEVILSAGAFNSPQILMLSGIGEAAELMQHGIQIQQDLPGVGKNLQDHLLVGAAVNAAKPVTLDSAESFPQVLGNLWKYLVHKKGPFSSNVAEAGGFVKTLPNLEAPDIQYHFAAAYFVGHGFDNPKGNGYSLGPCLLTPESRGTVKLQSANAKDKVLIDPRYLSEEEDVQTLLRATRIALKILEQPAFAPYKNSYFMPSSANPTDEEIIETMRLRGETLYHPVGTCKMGNDELSVVDSELKVKGIENLRVIDASVMPTVTRGNTNAPTIMIAEKGADLILSR